MKKKVIVEDQVSVAIEYLGKVDYLSFPARSKKILSRRLYLLQKALEARSVYLSSEKKDEYRHFWKLFNAIRCELVC